MAWADGQKEISNSEDVIDSREVEARIEFLTDERKDLADALEEAKGKATKAEAKEALESWDNDYKSELDALEAFKADLEGYCPDWRHGTALVRDSYWVDYVEEMLKDCGDLPQNLPSYIVIDWDKTAENIQMDYTSGEFDGVVYWAR